MSVNESVVFCSILDGHGGGQALAASNDTLRKPYWAHLDLKESGARGWLKDRGIDEQAVDTLVAQESRPRALALGDGLLTVLRGINRNDGEDPEDMVSIRIWLTEESIITVRHRKVRAAADVHAMLAEGNGPRSTAGTMLMIVERLAEGAGQFIDKIEDRVAEYEDRLASRELTQARSDLAEGRRDIASVRRYLAPQKAAMETLVRHGGRWFAEDQLYALRELADQFLRYVEDLDLLRERLLVLQEELMNRISQEQNERTYLLSIVAAIFLPITFISGVFGMNVAGLPGVEDGNAFLIVSVAMLFVSALIVAWMKFRRWF
jgi:zinc transporter